MADKLQSAYVRWFRPLVQALRELGGSATRPDATQRVIENEGISAEELSVTRGKNKQGKVQSEIDFARNTLASGGIIDRSILGKWTLTEYGMVVDLTDELIEQIIRKERETNRKNREARKAVSEQADGNSLGCCYLQTGVRTGIIPQWHYQRSERLPSALRCPSSSA